MKTDNIFMGIDVGKTGAVVIVNSDREILDIYDFVDVFSMSESLKRYAKMNINIAIIERLHAYKAQGVSSTWSLAENYGSYIGLLTAHQIPFQLVNPQEWQKGVLPKAVDDKNKKKRSLVVCRALYPESTYFKREKDHNRADAVLMALHGLKLVSSYVPEYRKVG